MDGDLDVIRFLLGDLGIWFWVAAKEVSFWFDLDLVLYATRSEDTLLDRDLDLEWSEDEFDELEEDLEELLDDDVEEDELDEDDIDNLRVKGLPLAVLEGAATIHLSLAFWILGLLVCILL